MGLSPLCGAGLSANSRGCRYRWDYFSFSLLSQHTPSLFQPLPACPTWQLQFKCHSLLACGGSDAEEMKWKAAAMPSSPREPGALPPGEETEQGNPGMFCPSR